MDARAPRPNITSFELMDGMRALAVLAIVINHARSLIFIDLPEAASPGWKAFYFVTGFGHQGVMIFFVLSGYWIAKKVIRRPDAHRFLWSEYGIDRLTRLWIVLIPALALGAALDLIGRFGLGSGLYLGTEGTPALTWDVGTRLDLVTALGNLLFVQTLLVAPLGSNWPLWSLATLFWCYVWFPPLYALAVKRKFDLPMLPVALVTMVLFRQLIPGFACWLFGALVFYAAETLGRRKISVTRLMPWAALILAGVGAWAASGLTRNSAPQDIVISGSFAALLFALILAGRSYPGWLSGICRYGAYSSFSLYVLHYPLLVLLAALFISPEYRLLPSLSPLVGFCTLTVLAVIFGSLFSRLTEVHTAAARAWLKRRWSTSAVRVGAMMQKRSS